MLHSFWMLTWTGSDQDAHCDDPLQQSDRNTGGSSSLICGGSKQIRHTSTSYVKRIIHTETLDSCCLTHPGNIDSSHGCVHPGDTRHIQEEFIRRSASCVRTCQSVSTGRTGEPKSGWGRKELMKSHLIRRNVSMCLKQRSHHFFFTSMKKNSIFSFLLK